MPRFVALMLALATLSACQYTEYYAEGQSVATRTRDLAQCESEAQTAHPPRIVTRFTPRVLRPGFSRCRSATQCVVVPPRWDGGRPYSEDLNADIRASAVTGCMGARGYAQVSLPVCAAGTAVVPSAVMAPLTDATCLIRTDGGALVVNP